MNENIVLHRVYTNTVTGADFQIVEIGNVYVKCRAMQKMKRGDVKTPVEWDMRIDLFERLMSAAGAGKLPQIVVNPRIV